MVLDFFYPLQYATFMVSIWLSFLVHFIYLYIWVEHMVLNFLFHLNILY